MRVSLRLKMVLVVVAVLLAPEGVVLASLAVERRYERQLRQNADFTAQEARAALEVAGDPDVAPNVRGAFDAGRLDALARLHRVRIRLLDGAGLVSVDVDHDLSRVPGERARRVLLGSKGDTLEQFEAALGPLAGRPEVREAIAGSASSGCRSGPGWDFVVCYAAHPVAGRAAPAVLYVEDSSRSYAVLHDLGGELGRLTLLTLPFALLLALWMGRRIVRPIEDLRRRTLARAAEANPRAGLAPRGGDETADLATAFQALLGALGEQRAANEAFITDLVHEFKNPVATIRACAESLGSTPPDEARAARLARLLLDSSTRLDTLVSQFLDLARAEAGMPHEPRTRVDLSALARGLVTAMSDDARFAGTKLVAEAEVTAEVIGVEYRLDSVIRNLLENAASFSGEGGVVTIVVAAREGRVELAVTDTGPGIAEQDLPKVFTRFFTTRGRERGSGLGLALTRAIIEAHGGNASVSSTAGQGATFRVELPAAPPA